ncbi:MAG: hypothetical protein ACNA8W_24250 [Bradymonadaceae bacterium]
MSRTSATTLPGYEFSAALDPHRRASLVRALKAVFKTGAHGPEPSIALVGWQAATLIDVVYEHAGRVVIIEEDEEILESIQRAVVAQSMGKKTTLLGAEPTSVRLDEKVDIAVCTATSAWFMEGPEAAILSNVKTHVVKKNGSLIPRRFVHLFELARPATEIAGISMRIPRFSRPGEPVAVLGESKHFLTTDMTKAHAIPAEVDDTIIVKPLVGGSISALRLTTLVELAEGIVQVTSQSGLQSIIVPLREDVDAQPDQPVSIRIRYTVGEGLATTRFTGRALASQETTTWEFSDHEVTGRFSERLVAMMDSVDRMGRGSDLDKVVSYTIQPHGDVSRLTALFWTIDEEFRKPLREIVESFRRDASAELGQVPSDEVIYDMMIQTYRRKRG